MRLANKNNLFKPVVDTKSYSAIGIRLIQQLNLGQIVCQFLFQRLRRKQHQYGSFGKTDASEKDNR